MKNEYAESYIYEVLKRIPKKMRKSSKIEIEKKIMEMCKYDERNIMEVLTKLGDPAEYAKRYNKNNSKFIGSEYGESYLAVLKPTMVCCAIVAAVFAFLKVAANFNVEEYLQTDNYVNFSISFSILLFEYVCSACIFAAIVITVIFILFQHQKNKRLEKETWSPDNLKPVINTDRKIDVGSCLTEMVIGIVIVGAFIICPQICGVYAAESSGTVHFIPMLNRDSWNSIILLVWTIVLTIFVQNIIELKSGIYTKKVLFLSFLLSVLRLVLSAVLIFEVPLVNYEFSKQLYGVKPELFKNGYESVAFFYRTILPWALMACAVFQFLFGFFPRLKKGMKSK